MSEPVLVSVVERVALTASIEQSAPVTVAMAARGPAGPTGPQGPPGTIGIELVADIPLGGHRLIATDGNDGVRYADCTQPEDAHALSGMTLTAAIAGDTVSVQRYGVIEEPSWAWTPGLPVYLGHAGVPTQSLPGDAVISQVVGIPTTPTSLFVAPREPVAIV